MSSAATETHLPTGTWQIDATHSQVGFAVEYMVGTFRGTFSPVEAKLEVAEDGSATLTGSARVDAIKIDSEYLVTHLKGPDFFDEERAPEITFKSTEITSTGSDLTIKGELAIKGNSRPVELRGKVSGPITDGYERERLGLVLETTVDRTQFGIDWQNPLPSGEPSLANDVKLTAELYLIKD
jgi:polyisoprenoid-binding protein YceI